MARDFVFAKTQIGEHGNGGFRPRAKMVERRGRGSAWLLGHDQCCLVLMDDDDRALGGVQDLLGDTAQHHLAQPPQPTPP